MHDRSTPERKDQMETFPDRYVIRTRRLPQLSSNPRTATTSKYLIYIIVVLTGFVNNGMERRKCDGAKASHLPASGNASSVMRSNITPKVGSSHCIFCITIRWSFGYLYLPWIISEILWPKRHHRTTAAAAVVVVVVEHLDGQVRKNKYSEI